MTDASLIRSSPDLTERPALIEAFGITGLHGYRTISLATDDAVSILIARNGSGKTTLLGVLNAFLKGQLFRLRGLEFETIFCKFRDYPDQLVLSKSDLEQAVTVPDKGELVVAASRLGMQPEALFKFLTEEWPDLDSSNQYYENTTYAALSRQHGYGRTKIVKVIEDLTRSAYEKNENISYVIRATRHALAGCEVLYLPTYRRLELPTRETSRENKYKKRRSIIDASAGGLFTGDIQFGLADIADRLTEMNEKIVHDSNQQYRKISADIISGLLDGSFDAHDPSTDTIPLREDLELFFLRVEQSHRYGPAYPVTVPNMDEIYSGQKLTKSSRKFLDYFLGQLNKVIESTSVVEYRVQEFIKICNSYLQADEYTTRLSHPDVDAPPEGKRLALNRRTLQVSVVCEGRRISLDALSSGEKQMISLFAKLFLYERPKIVLIDEPELSLSIDWQRKILVDVTRAPLCRQLIAITHSPFVFDNELEPFAGSLTIDATPKEILGDSSATSIFEDDAFDE